LTADATAKALAEAYSLLFADPARSAELCRAVLAKGDDPSARLMLAGALRLAGDAAGAFDIADALLQSRPNWAGAHYERALALGALGRHEDALTALARVERMGAGLPGLEREIGDCRWALGDQVGAGQAYLRHIGDPVLEPLVQAAAIAQQQGDRAAAEARLKLQLHHFPGDVLALRRLAELQTADGRYDEAIPLLERALERAPAFALARYGLALSFLHEHRPAAALEQVERLLQQDSKRLEYLDLKAEALARLGDFDAAASVLAATLALHPEHATGWSTYGDILRTLGRRGDCEAAYKRAIALDPRMGVAYWGLANLKTFRFQPADTAAMRAQLPLTPGGDQKASMLFALGKALEDEGKFDDAFAAYKQANAERRALLPHDAEEHRAKTRRARAVFTPAFFAERSGSGAQADDPIFIVGMPRSGSTLVEQILASHSAVEGTQELVELLAIARRLGRAGDYPELLRGLPATDLRSLGEGYLERTRIYRRTAAPRFIDKMPNNFTETGLIHLILPNARIIDVRRNPLACCVSNFKQHWAVGQSFAYDLADIGAFYRAYVELMAHFDAALPGRVHRVIYEDLVADPERETRRLLDACGLPFEDQCLRFYENTRAVRTPSSEQVRRPISSAGVDNWRPFDPHLGPLKAALGPVLDAYPNAPPL
jgi:tetratricopeptide (TPR) repeat protein